MKRRLWIAAFLSLTVIGSRAGLSRAQSSPTASAAAAASDIDQERPTARPDPTVIGPPAFGARAPVAMLGYSPVSLLNTRQWVKGRDQYKVIFDGAAYLLANQRELQTFRAAPERYLPALGGDCVVHFVKTGRRRPGLLRHGVVHEGRLFFMSSSENRQAFVDNPETYMDADLALAGNCPVCLVELNKEVPGQAELAAVLDGYRYLFPGAQQREMFIAQPMKYAAAAHAIAGGSPPAGPAMAARVPLTTTSPVRSERVGTDDAAPAAPAPDHDELPAPIPVALAGYCPVSILEENRWIRGRAEYALVHDGRRYLFAGQAQQQAFLKDLVKYVPALGGDCVVTWKDRGQRVEGSVYHAVIHRGRQYLFPSTSEKEKFKQNPDAFADVDLALDGMCAVRRVETGQDVEGKAELTMWHQGLRYQLAGPEELELFQKNREKYTKAGDGAEAATRDSTEKDEFFNPFE